MPVPIIVQLTDAQLGLASEAIEAHTVLGDCELHGHSLRFQDYEGAVGFQHRLRSIKPRTRRHEVSLIAARCNLDVAIRAWERARGEK